MASSNNVTKNNTANNYAAVSRYATAAASSGWGGMPSSSLASAASITNSATSTGVSKTLADYVKESAAWQHSMAQQQQPQQQTTSGTASLPWAAAIKAAEHLHNAVAANAASMAANTFETRNSTIGSWCSPETSSSHRGGWGSDGSMKGDGAPDDGTAIWGNPSVKKTGVDWTEKESLSKPPQVNSNNSEKRAPKLEPTISSIHGTEAWGAPPAGGSGSSLKSATNSQQQSNLNDNSGNTYVTKTATINNESLGWGESSSLQGNNESSSPPNNSIWNNLASNGKQKSTTDWLSSSSSSAASTANQALTSSRMDNLNKQLESTSLFDSISSSSLVKDASNSSSSSSMNNNHSKYDDHSSTISNSSTNNLINAGAIGGGLIGSNSINDLKHMSANFSNDSLDSTSRSSGGSALSSGNNQQSQLNTYNLGISPSRDLLKQMVHQIQLAVQAGHLNAQILNQPMSTPTLQLVYTLLQQIRLLQQFQDIQQRTVSKTNDINQAPNNLDLQIGRVQQNISLLQKAITQQQAALAKNDSLVDKNTNHQQQAANNFSYANISKLSTNMKVPPGNISNLISNNSIDSFKRSSLIDTLTGNSNSDLQRSAQATIDANAAIDKNLAPLLQASVINNRAQSFSNAHTASQQQQQQAQKTGMLAAQLSSSSSASTAAWLAFNSSDLVSSGWNRISPNVSQQDMMSEFVGSRGWRDSALMPGNDGKDIPSAASLAPGANVNTARSNSASNNLKQMSETNDILSKNQSSFYEWGNESDSLKSNLDSDSTGSGSLFSPSAIGGLSSQSNPWLFAPTSSSINASGLDNLIGKSINSGHLGKLDNGSSDKVGGDGMNFLHSASAAGNAQRNSAASYNGWGGIDSFNVEHNPIGSKPAILASNSGSITSSAKIGANSQGGARPAPPPGILAGFASTSIFGDANGANDNNESMSRKHANENQMSARESPANLWNEAWLD